MSRYTLYIQPQTFQEIKTLPGQMRQRIRQSIRELADNPRPALSKQLDWSDSPELRRLRLDNWRIIYLVTEIELTIDVLAIRKRPPYDYGDLKLLLED